MGRRRQGWRVAVGPGRPDHARAWMVGLYLEDWRNSGPLGHNLYFDCRHWGRRGRTAAVFAGPGSASGKLAGRHARDDPDRHRGKRLPSAQICDSEANALLARWAACSSGTAFVRRRSVVAARSHVLVGSDPLGPALRLLAAGAAAGH